MIESLRLLPMILGLLSMLCGTSSVHAQDGNAPQFIYHKKGAGKLDATGWTSAQSTEGAFLTQTPCLFNDMTVLQKVEGQPPRFFGVACERSDNVRFTAYRFEFVEGKSKPMGPSTFVANPPLSNAEKTWGKIGGIESVDLTINQKGQCFYGRIFNIDNDTVLLMVEPVGLPVNCSNLKNDAQKFLDAFEVVK